MSDEQKPGGRNVGLSAGLGALLPCPFCGETPMYSAVEERDGRRYIRMELECCTTMRASMSWGQYKLMTDANIEAALTEKLVRQWNRRAPNAEIKPRA